jgi:uncharacterized protein (TIGR03437 family)
MAGLLYTSGSQINFLLPAGTAPGVATVTVNSAVASAQTATVTVETVAPALFSMSANGHGVAAATAVRVTAANPGAQTAVPVFQCVGIACLSTPIPLDTASMVYVTLYGTGIRNRESAADVTVTVNGVSVPVLYAGVQPEFDGLDQINIAIPFSLRGAGEAGVLLTIHGSTSNSVVLNFQ